MSIRVTYGKCCSGIDAVRAYAFFLERGCIGRCNMYAGGIVAVICTHVFINSFCQCRSVDIRGVCSLCLFACFFKTILLGTRAKANQGNKYCALLELGRLVECQLYTLVITHCQTRATRFLNFVQDCRNLTFVSFYHKQVRVRVRARVHNLSAHSFQKTINSIAISLGCYSRRQGIPAL